MADPNNPTGRTSEEIEAENAKKDAEAAAYQEQLAKINPFAPGSGFDTIDTRAMTGTSSGTGKHVLNPESYKDPYSQQTREQLAGQLSTYQGRTAPTTTAAQRANDEVSTYQAAQVAPNERAYGGVVAPTAQANSGVINREDQQFRQGQAALVAQLQEQAAGRGPSLATMQLRQATDRNIAQQMAVTAAQGGNPAMTMRAAQANAALANRQAGIDSATMRVQEQLSAREQLASALANARAQDIGVNTSQAGFDQQTNLANMEQLNQLAVERARLSQQNNQFNAGQTNTTNLAQAQLTQQASQFNAGAWNDLYSQNADARQQTQLANLQSQLQTMGLNDQQVRSILAMQLQQNEADRTASIQYQQDRMNQDLAIGAAQDARNARAAQTTAQYFSAVGQALPVLGDIATAGSKRKKGDD